MKKLLLLLLVVVGSAQALTIIDRRGGGHGGKHHGGKHHGGGHGGGRRHGGRRRHGGGRHRRPHRRGGWGGWLGGGWGSGRWGGSPWIRYPQGPYWRTPGAPPYTGPVVSYDFWEITNSTPGTITVYTSAGTYTLARGEVRRIPKTGNRRVEVYADYNGQTQVIRTSEDFLLVSDDYYRGGALMIQPYSSGRR